MKTNTQAGFIPFIIALIIALSVGGGVVAYRSNEHRKEAKLEEELKLDAEKGVVESKLATEGSSKSSESLNPKKKVEDRDDRYEDEDEDDDDNVAGSSGGTTLPPAPTTSASYTLAEVKLHGTKTDCWTVVNGSVYNVTSWISQHPGGQMAITSMCGVDEIGRAHV